MGIQALRGFCARQLAIFSSPGAYLLVIGHADTLGHRIPGHNQKLSQRRADNTVEAIKRILRDKFRIQHVTSVGWGDKLALLAAQSKIGPAPQRRRVDIYLNGNLELMMY